MVGARDGDDPHVDAGQGDAYGAGYTRFFSQPVAQCHAHLRIIHIYYISEPCPPAYMRQLKVPFVYQQPIQLSAVEAAVEARVVNGYTSLMP